jgi:hypothetical protein
VLGVNPFGIFAVFPSTSVYVPFINVGSLGIGVKQLVVRQHQLVFLQYHALS